MIRVVSSELLKLRTTRTFYGLAGAAVGLVMLSKTTGVMLLLTA